MILGVQTKEVLKRSLIIIIMALVASGVYFVTLRTTSTQTMHQQSESDVMYGVTIDRINDIDLTLAALRHLPGRLTSRIVFDEHIQPDVYNRAVDQLYQETDLMGGILDSLYFKDYSVDEYTQRTQDYVQTFNDSIAIWEAGNEINGEWLVGAHETRTHVIDKVTNAYNIVKQYSGRAAITLYYNEGCAEKPEHEMFRWVRSELPISLKQSVDYVLISHYEDSCPDIKPDWQQTFERLRAEFPYAKLGFGEVGLENKNATIKDKQASLRRYYAIRPDVSGFIGGYFWWHFWDDMVVPMQRGDTTMIDVLGEAISH